MQQSTVILITLVCYKLVLIAIGLWASRRMHDETDFFLGGRQLGPWVAGLSYAASTSSAWVLLGFSGFVFTTGLSALWMVPGIWAGYAIVWLWFGPRLRSESLQFGFDNALATSAQAYLSWGEVKVPFEVSLPVMEK